MKRHIFLTGARGIGKSTILDGLIAQRPGARVGGFRTVTRFGDHPENVYMIPGGAPREAWQAYCRPENIVGVRGTDGASGDPLAFNRLGCALLAPGDAAILRMDELGMLEREAEDFSAAVLRALNGAIPVLGVVQPRDTPLLAAVRAHPAVCLIKVTETNRDALGNLGGIFDGCML